MHEPLVNYARPVSMTFFCVVDILTETPIYCGRSYSVGCDYLEPGTVYAWGVDEYEAVANGVDEARKFK